MSPFHSWYLKFVLSGFVDQSCLRYIPLINYFKERICCFVERICCNIRLLMLQVMIPGMQTTVKFSTGGWLGSVLGINSCRRRERIKRQRSRVLWFFTKKASVNPTESSRWHFRVLRWCDWARTLYPGIHNCVSGKGEELQVSSAPRAHRIIISLVNGCWSTSPLWNLKRPLLNSTRIHFHICVGSSSFSLILVCLFLFSVGNSWEKEPQLPTVQHILKLQLILSITLLIMDWMFVSP